MTHTWIELDRKILRGNLRALEQALRPRTQIIFVVKADAYGHGMLPVARAAYAWGVRHFAVVHAEEGVALRPVVRGAKILLLGVTHPRDVPAVMKHRLIPIVVDAAHARSLAAAARKAAPGAALPCHVKIDTGMGRLGFAWQEAGAVLPALGRRSGLDITGACTHLAAAAGNDTTFSAEQVRRFQSVLRTCEAAGLHIPFHHVSNSGGIRQNANWDFHAVRAGILLYGYGTTASGRTPRSFRPVPTRPFLQWKTRVLQVKKVPAGFPVSYDCTYVTRHPTQIATIDAGYSDGISRLLSSRGCVLIRGQRCPILGRVTMNLIAVDLGPVTSARRWDEVVLVGRQGHESIWADEVAKWRNTISYEVLTGIRTDDRRLIH